MTKEESLIKIIKSNGNCWPESCQHCYYRNGIICLIEKRKNYYYYNSMLNQFSSKIKFAENILYKMKFKKMKEILS